MSQSRALSSSSRLCPNVIGRPFNTLRINSAEGFVFVSDWKSEIFRCARLCENSVHGSTELTTNGYETLQIKHLAVRPELRRRAPKEFSHSLANARDLRKISPFGRNDKERQLSLGVLGFDRLTTLSKVEGAR